MKRSEITKIFKALGNERRFLIVKHILDQKELTVSQISELINLSFKSTSRHLSVLKNANLVVSRQTDLNNFYSLNNEFAREFVKFLKF
ncbi:MAG: metalloregulator ArsR/SmtB family transcription factor [Patescibacteria group bacterium]